MPAATVILNNSQITQLLRSPSGPVVQDLLRRGNNVLNRSRQLVPVDRGALRASLHAQLITLGGQPAVRIGSPLHYARYVHDGTGIYAGRGYITPRNGRYLVWRARTASGGRGGAYVFARRVRGIPGTPYLTNALPAAAA